MNNELFRLGRQHYYEGISSDATDHCSDEVKNAWLAGWRDAEREHKDLQSRASANGNGGRVFTVHRDS